MVRRWLRRLVDLVKGLVLIAGLGIVLRPPRRKKALVWWCPYGGEQTDPMTADEFAEHCLLARRMREQYGPWRPEPDTEDSRAGYGPEQPSGVTS